MTPMQRRGVLRQLAGVAAAASIHPLWAQSEYPDKTVRIVVPFPAGALTDSLGRFVAEKLRLATGQGFIVENRPGAGTLLGASVVAKAPPDGYSLLIATSTTLAISPAMYTNPPAVPGDFTGVAMIGSVTLLLVTRPDFPARNLSELVALVREKPGRYNFASPGNGTMHQLIFEMIKAQQRVFTTHIPYQGTIPALTDLMAGRVDFMFIDAAAGLPQVRADKVKLIAVAAAKRTPVLPNVPTVVETYPSVNIQAWQAVVAPKGTPQPIINKLNAELNKALSTPESRAALQQMGVEANPMQLAELNELFRTDALRFAELVKFSGAKAT